MNSTTAPAPAHVAEAPLALDECLGYHDRVPLLWQPLAAMPSAAQLAQWQDHNLRLLAAAALLDERPRRAEADEPLAGEVERLHHKFDLMLDLLGALLRQQAPLPSAVAARITPQGLSWLSDTAPAPGALILLHLHLHPGLPSALLWPSEALAAVTGEAAARFLSLGESCALAMERHVFVRHRRSVADARSPAGRGETGAAQ
ncbi:MAG TPA: PilZ domain-containing protein [Solimonas sp.]